MKIGIFNLHNMCENNTFFLSKAQRYFSLNGHTVTNEEDDVDLVFVGGCAVTDMMRLRCEIEILQAMEQEKKAHFIIFGCLAAFPEGLQSIADQKAGRLHIIPFHASHELDELIRARVPFDAIEISQLMGHFPYQPRMGPDDSYVMIAQGCVNNCSYCNIKKAKGTVKSRAEEIIVAEVQRIYAKGIRTVTLLADDCGSYGMDQGTNLPSLLSRLSHVAPDLRYKLYTVFPALFLEHFEEIAPFFSEGRLPYICLPAQSASPRVLGLMNRRYDPARLAEAVARIRVLDPDAFIYSHFIFNFPTETWEEFEQSVAFARHFDYCVFIGYGENSSTRAAALVPKCDNHALETKVSHLEALVEQEELAAFVVPSP